MRDPVLDRQMFRDPEVDTSAKGVVSLVEGESDYDRRKRLATEMIAAAKEKQNPENFKTLAEQSRPGVFRPVATGQPQAPQPNTQQQMAQMQAMGFRPVGMADGGYVKHFAEGGLGTLDISGPTMMVPGSEPILDTGFDPMGNYTGAGESEMIEVPDTSPKGDRRANPSSLPYASPRTVTDAERGIVSIRPPEKPPEKDLPKEGSKDSGGDLPPTKMEDIKAGRKENIAMAMIQAGLAMAGGQSPNALANIAAGGISGIGAFREAEKDRIATEFEQRKYDEDKLARIQRSQELRQEKDLTREARVYDTAQGNITNIDREIGRLQTEMSKAMGDDATTEAIQTRIDQLLEDRAAAGSVVNRSLRNLGYQGEDIFSSGQRPVTPTIGVGSIIYQNNKPYRVTRFENGKPVEAEPVN
jgi:hypothetical protein